MKFIDNLIDEDITLILIAHRLSTLRNCDVIYEVSNSNVHKVDFLKENLKLKKLNLFNKLFYFKNPLIKQGLKNLIIS